mmetsp:Transcript_10945/g.25425  ORF Transcript_10945/g.25425 Transcript_10945/m.25425 type:complete len:167 (+) Transcript_10945:7123-7623(+)
MKTNKLNKPKKKNMGVILMLCKCLLFVVSLCLAAACQGDQDPERDLASQANPSPKTKAFKKDAIESQNVSAGQGQCGGEGATTASGAGDMQGQEKVEGLEESTQPTAVGLGDTGKTSSQGVSLEGSSKVSGNKEKIYDVRELRTEIRRIRMAALLSNNEANLKSRK